MADDQQERVERLAAFLREVAELRRHADAVEYRAVQLARSYGATWEDIAEPLGISRQAAASRFEKVRRRHR